MPERIQLSRKKGWRKPENTVVVARPSKWGNPYRISEESVDNAQAFVVRGSHVMGVFDTINDARREAVDLFELNIGPMGAWEYDRDTLVRLIDELRGKNLACWCPLDQPCHADVLLDIANRDQP